MATFYRKGRRSEWTPLDDDVDLREWARAQLEDEAYQDNDNGYSEYVEFDRDGVRTYAYATFGSWHVGGFYKDDESGGEMESFDYGSEEYIKDAYGDYAVKRYAMGPNRDWLKVASSL